MGSLLRRVKSAYPNIIPLLKMIGILFCQSKCTYQNIIPYSGMVLWYIYIYIYFYKYSMWYGCAILTIRAKMTHTEVASYCFVKFRTNERSFELSAWRVS